MIRVWRTACAEFIPVPGLRPRDPPGDLLDQRHRIAPRLPPDGQGPWPLPDRAGSVKCLYLDTRSLDAKGTGPTLGDAVEARPEHLRRHLRRPDAGRREPLNKMNATYTV